MKRINKKTTIVIMAVAVAVMIFLILRGKNPPTSPVTPPVQISAPDIKLNSVDPVPGPRESIDTFSHTAFEFSKPIRSESISVNVSPYIPLNKRVYPENPSVLYVTPNGTPWQEGVTYVIRIEPGEIGMNGEILKEAVVYSFSNDPPDYIELNNPI